MTSSDYPETVEQVLDDEIGYGEGILVAVTAFAASRPWRGSFESRKKKLQSLNAALAHACHVAKPDLIFQSIDGSSSGASHYIPSRHRIVMIGKLSVVTFLHEFAHALGHGEKEACRWSINLFRQCFPEQYSRLVHVGHTLVVPKREE